MDAALARTRRVGPIAPAILTAAARQLLDGLLDGNMSETAYDTALVSFVRASRDRQHLAFPASLSWLRRHQHADGSWGGRIATAHDRLVSTLAAITRLAEHAEGWARQAVQQGVAYIWRHANDWVHAPHETIAFELVVPRFLEDARRLELALPFAAFERLAHLRDEKLSRIPDGYLYDRPTTLLHSLEYLGNRIDVDRIGGVRAANGSYGNSPSATAHVLAHTGDAAAEAYLDRVMAVSLNGGACNVYPFEVFEKAWVLYNLGPKAIRLPGARAHLAYLRAGLQGGAVGISREGLVSDADDTAMTLVVLHRVGGDLPVDALLQFEREDCFSCFPFERNTSISANAHVLEALTNSPARPRQTAAIAKVDTYLRHRRLDGRYWLDKWHISPYYAAAQVAIARRAVADDLLAPTVAWLLEAQRADGGWGSYAATSEETAYAMQALFATGRKDRAIGVALTRGANYLAERFEDTDYPEQWIGKGLYTPYAVVRSAVIGALQQYLDARWTGRSVR